MKGTTTHTVNDDGTVKFNWGVNNTINGFYVSAENFAKKIAELKNAYAEGGTVQNPISFIMTDEMVKGSVNDSIVRWKGDPAVTFDGSKRPSSKVYFVYMTENTYTPVSVTLKYTDGTTAEKKLYIRGAAASSWYKDAEGFVGTTGALSWTPKCLYPEDSNQIRNYEYTYEIDGETKMVQNTALNDMLQVSYIEVDQNKVIDTITLGDSGNRATFFGVTEGALTNAELDAGARVGIKDGMTTSDFIYAAACVEELVRRGADRNDYPDYEYAAAGDDPAYIYTDLTPYFNADTIANDGDTVGASWLGGLSTNGGHFQGMAGNNLTHVNGIVTVDEEEAELDTAARTSKWVKTGKTLNAYLPVEGFTGGVNDAVLLGGNVTEPTTIKLSSRPIDKLYFAVNRNGGASSVYPVVTYTDGTTETLEWTIRTSPSLIYTSYETRESFKNNNITIGHINFSNYYCDVQDNTVTVKKGSDNGWHDPYAYTIYTLDLKADKAAESISFERSDHQFLLAGITEVPVSMNKLESFVNEVKAYDYAADENAQSIELAKTYTDELVRRHVLKSTDDTVVYIDNLVNQIKLMDNYVDLSDYLDTDIMVTPGEAKPNNYSGRDTELYNGSLIPADGKIKMVKGNSAEAAEDEYIGTEFKLSGAYNTVGNDAVSVNKEGSGVTVELNNMLYKNIRFVLDTNEYKGSNFGTNIGVRVNYGDGTSDDLNTILYYSCAYYTPRNISHVGGFGRVIYSEENGVFEALNTNISGNDPNHMFPSAILDADNNEAKLTKEVKSITFLPNASYNYNIIAINAQPYSVDELLELYDNAWTAEINADTVDMIEMGAKAGIELYNQRKLSIMVQDDYNSCLDILKKCDEFRKMQIPMFEIVPSLEVSDTTVTCNALITNTTDTDEGYMLVVAVYGEGNKLLSVGVTDDKTAVSKTINAKDSVFCANAEGAVKYKAFVWESKESMKPVAVIEK